jgi:cell wall-associated NlpC family hydrolase
VIRKLAWAVPVCLFGFASSALAEDVVDLAAQMIGRPYVWGAEGPNAFDCSGLTQYVYQEVGINLPRRAINQSTFGDPAGRRLQRGDLLFFSNDSRQSLVTHVGLYEGDGVMIDASKRHGRVRRDNLDDPFWVERFMFARRVRLGTGGDDSPDRRADHRTATIRVLGRIAGELLKLPRGR